MKTLFKSVLSILLIATSCQKEPFIRFGFDTDFDRNAKGLSIMYVGNSSNLITLSGEVFVVEGEVLIELIDPRGEAVFSSLIVSPQILHVNETFPALSGNWSLKYRSLEGEGTIILHLDNDKQ